MSSLSLRLVLGDQLSRSVASLVDAEPRSDIVLMAEVAEEASYVPHHKQKIALVLSAMRHFAAELAAAGFTVDYIRLDQQGNTGSLTGEVGRAVKRHKPDRLIATAPGEWRVQSLMRAWSGALSLPVEIREDDRFFCSRARFARWAEGRKTYRMEFFYREMRRETEVLMERDAPVGGRWNFDAQNRKRLPATIKVPQRPGFPPDATTRDVLDLVAAKFAENFGTLEGFGWAVTRTQALEALDWFIAEALPHFGDYQDAMKAGEPFLFHAVLSPYLNLGLLEAREVCQAAERAYRKHQAPLAAVEGFIRQILGWREFVRGVYWLHMPDYATGNALNATRPLPWFYWSGQTRMRCLADVVETTRRHAYAHHIQRLMVTGNFALLAGISPREVEAWYLAVYADAYDWVELPNTHGMVMFADGGLLASKPYAASGAYIDRMSNYCAGCAYDPKVKSGAKACPFNLLYWNFLMEHRDALGRNPRLAMPYRNLDAMDEQHRLTLAREARRFLANLPQAPDSADAAKSPDGEEQLPLDL